MGRPKKKRVLDTRSHIADNELLPYAELKLSSHRQEEAIIHIQTCDYCAIRVREIKAENRIYPCN